jgi:hypothetical protein
MAQRSLLVLGVTTMLMELDGCEMRTGVFVTAAAAGLSDREPQK